MREGRFRKLSAVIASAYALGASPALATGPPGSEWTPLNDVEGLSAVGMSNTNEIGLERTADGVLHVLWVNDRGDGSEALLHSPFVGTKPGSPGLPGPTTRVLSVLTSADRSLNDNVDLLPSGGGLRALFSLTNPGNPNDGILSTSTSATGDSWTPSVTASASATGQRSPVYAASGISGGVGLDGTTYSTWGDSSPSGGGYHVGLSPASPDNPFSPACCEIDPNVGVDSVSGEVMVASNLPDTGIRIESLSSGTTRTVSKSAHAWTGQRTSISGRVGAPGIYVAWGTGDNMFNARPALWKVGAPKFKFLKNQHDAAHVGMTPAPEGRLWVYWDRDGKVYASRTNRAATKFGAIVKIPGALGAETFYRLAGEGSLGPLDIFALTQTDSALNWWTERIVPGLTLKCDGSAAQGQKLGCEVTDAGEPVGGIQVYSVLGGKEVSDVSSPQGKAKLKIPAKASPGKEKARTGFDHEWTGAKTVYKIKKK
jgi:hypothetical protein